MARILCQIAPQRSNLSSDWIGGIEANSFEDLPVIRRAEGLPDATWAWLNMSQPIHVRTMMNRDPFMLQSREYVMGMRITIRWRSRARSS